MERKINLKSEEGIFDSDELNKKLGEIIIQIFFRPILFLIFYLLIELTDFYELKYMGRVVFGFFIGTIIGIVINGVRTKYIYKYSFKNEDVKLYLVNIFGRKKTSSISVNQINKIKYRAKGFWRNNSKVWIHLKENVDEYSFIENKLGINFCDKINVEKI